MTEVTIWTDGACIGNPGPGGYGVVLVRAAGRTELAGGFRRTTNNRMEMMAAIVALRALDTPSTGVLHSDSLYLVKAVEKGWARKWRASGWMRTRTERAKNHDLWDELLGLAERHRIRFAWVKGHAGHRENECCDGLATRAARGRDLPPDRAFEDEGRGRAGAAPGLFDG